MAFCSDNKVLFADCHSTNRYTFPTTDKSKKIVSMIVITFFIICIILSVLYVIIFMMWVSKVHPTK